MELRRCLSCMREYPEGETRCQCGNVHGEEKQPPYALRCGSILNGKYLVGKMIGQGGFGITYVGLDLVLDKKVAIKEYYPVSSGTVSRSGSTGDVMWHDGSVKGMSREDGYKSFLKEARKMAKLDEIPGIVGVKELFDQNETAYIVMNFVEGMTMKDIIMKRGTMSFADCVNILSPVIKALDRAHRQGIIHRDISPDNIMIDPNGKAWVLDMGAAKDLELQAMDGTQMRSSQLMVKPGFSPPEQYMATGKIGTWSDVYAMSATIFYCVTGKIPPMAPDRVFNDSLQRQPPLTDREFDVLKDGMGFDPTARIQTMSELYRRLQSALIPATVVSVSTPPAEAAKTQPEPPQVSQKQIPPAPEPPDQDRRLNRWIILLLALMLAVASIGVALFVRGRGEQQPEATEPSTTETTTVPTTKPTLVREEVTTETTEEETEETTHPAAQPSGKTPAPTSPKPTQPREPAPNQPISTTPTETWDPVTEPPEPPPDTRPTEPTVPPTEPILTVPPTVLPDPPDPDE